MSLKLLPVVLTWYVELEDGIAPHDKEEARKHALNLFKDDKGFENVERILRINSIRTQFGIEDLQVALKSETLPRVNASESHGRRRNNYCRRSTIRGK